MSTSPLSTSCKAVGITDAAALERLTEMTSTRRLARGETLVRQGDERRYIVFVASGIVRTFFVDDDGKEITDCIVMRNDVPVLASCDQDSPTRESVQALSACELLCIDADLLFAASTSDPACAGALIAILDAAWKLHWNLRNILRQKDARERYLWFLQEYPGLIDLIPHYYIASFLSITPVTLSRVRMALRREQRGEEKPSARTAQS